MIPISDIIEAYKTCYNSIEFFILAYKHENEWFNLISVLYCLDKVIDNPKEMILYDKKDIKLIKLERNFEDLKNYFEKIKNGYIETSEFKIKIREAFDPDRLMVQLDNLKNIKEIDKAEIFFIRRAMGTERDILERMTDDSIRMGYKNPYEYISEKIGIKDFNSNNQNDIYIILPIYIKIKDKKIENKKLILTLSHHKNIDDIQINLEIYRNDYSNKIISRNMLCCITQVDELQTRC